jgi:fluoride exporter
VIVVVVALAGGVGAVARYLVDGAVSARVSGPFPWGTTTVNLTGSFVLGLLTGLVWYHGLPSHLDAVLGTGLCGGLTTWSTASWESVRLVERGLLTHALAYGVGALVVAALAAAGGMALASL